MNASQRRYCFTSVLFSVCLCFLNLLTDFSNFDFKLVCLRSLFSIKQSCSIVSKTKFVHNNEMLHVPESGDICSGVSVK